MAVDSEIYMAEVESNQRLSARNLELEQTSATQQARIEALRDALKIIQTGDCDYPEQIARAALLEQEGE